MKGRRVPGRGQIVLLGIHWSYAPHNMAPHQKGRKGEAETLARLRGHIHLWVERLGKQLQVSSQGQGGAADQDAEENSREDGGQNFGEAHEVL